VRKGGGDWAAAAAAAWERAEQRTAHPNASPRALSLCSFSRWPHRQRDSARMGTHSRLSQPPHCHARPRTTRRCGGGAADGPGPASASPPADGVGGAGGGPRAMAARRSFSACSASI